MTTLRRNPMLLAGAIGVTLFAAIAIVAPMIWADEANALGGVPYQPASADHLFGTDALGRDMLARTLVATRLTLLMTAGATALGAGLGIFLGSVIWVAGARVREIGQRVIDVLVSYPAILIAIFVAAILAPSASTSVWAIGLAIAPAFARLTTNLAASVATRDFVSSARLLGVPPLRLLRRHILPNIAEPLLVLASVAYTISLKAMAGLSFIGLGVQPPDYDWGRLLKDGLGSSIHLNPALALGPAVFIVLAGLAGSLIGDGLAASADPSQVLGRSTRRHSKLRAATEIARRRATAARHDAPEALVEVRDLTVALPTGTRLVDGVSFDIRPGEIVGIVGESGSGKSLTAMSIAQLLPPELAHDATTLRVGDLDLTGKADPKALATRIGIVYQDPSSSFNPTLKVGGQLTETLTVHGKMSRRKARMRAIEQLRQAHVTLPEHRVKQHPHELSGGMRQRAMIASALLTGPDLLIADEPTTALDVTVQAQVLRTLQEANERDRTAILLISHDIAVVSSLCHRVFVMYSGQIMEELTVEQLRAGHAHHPYTKALLAATPQVTDDREPAAIPGRPPQPGQVTTGCVFAPRCPIAREVCGSTAPDLLPTSSGAAACHAVSWERSEVPS